MCSQKYCSPKTYLYWLLLSLSALLSLSTWAVDSSRSQADQVFQEFSQSIFQVQIINVQSGSQSAIGSGFLVKDGRLVATNYHVISFLVNKPERYVAKIIRDGQSIELDLIMIDVVNDLAILQPKEEQIIGSPLLLSTQELNQGETLFSIGNPHDIGMTVVQGIYNGLVDHRIVDSIHFSGAINAGMSGGPTLNEKGEVVGINVASSGNQIGFLVPTKQLVKLLEQYQQHQGQDFHTIIARQVGAFSEKMVEQLLEQPWPQEVMGQSLIVGRISDNLECWGDSEQREDVGLEFISRGCHSKDRIFIHDQFDVGKMEYEYHYTQADNWNPLVFYRFMQAKITGARPVNRVNKSSVNNFSCEIKLVEFVHNPSDVNTLSSQDLNKKVNYCVRSYKKIPHLYDVFYLATTIDKNNIAIMEHYTLSGVTQKSANQFLARFIGTLSWE